MNEERKKIVQTWSEHLDPIRFERREYGIRKWLEENDAGNFYSQVNELLDSLNKNEILNEFITGTKTGLEFCIEYEKIQALDYSWYYGGDPRRRSLCLLR